MNRITKLKTIESDFSNCYNYFLLWPFSLQLIRSIFSSVNDLLSQPVERLGDVIGRSVLDESTSIFIQNRSLVLGWVGVTSKNKSVPSSCVYCPIMSKDPILFQPPVFPHLILEYCECELKTNELPYTK